VLLIIIILLPFPAFGQSDEPASEPLPVFDLGLIAVTSTAVEPVNVAATRVQAAEFDQQLDQSLTEAVAEVPGVILTVGSKNEPQILLRGMHQQRSLILYDGVPMASGYYGDLDASELPLDNLAEVEIVRGNASVMYGPNAMAGVVSLVSAKPGSQPNLRLLTSVDDEGNSSARASHGARFGAFYYQLAAGLRETDGFNLSGDFQPTYDRDGNSLEDGDLRENSAFSQWSGGVKIGMDNESGEWSFAVNTQSAEKDIPPSTSPDARTSYRKFDEWSKTNLMAAGRLLVTDSLEVRGNLYYHTYDNILEDYSDSTYSNVRWRSTYDDYSLGALGRVGWTLTPQWTWRFGFTSAIENHRSQGDTGDPWEEYESRTYAVMTEGEFQPQETLAFVLGASWEIFDWQSADGLNADQQSLDNRTSDIAAPAFSFSARYDVTDEHELTGALTNRNRFPTMNQLFSNIEDFEPEDIGSLDPERALEYSLGYRYHPASAVQLGAAAYYYDVEDLIERINKDWLYENIDHAEFSGIEIWGKYGAAQGVQAQLSYAFMDATGTYAQGAERDLPYVPDHLLHLAAGYKFTFGTTLEARVLYRADAIEYDSRNNKLDLPSYTIYDLNVRHEFPMGLGLILQGSNLTDEDYYQETGFPLAGRTVKLGISYTL